MPIARKPILKPRVSEKKINEIIGKGGSVPLEKTSKDSKSKTDQKEQTVNLRLPEDILNEIDESVNSRRIKISRHTWLMEALVEKLDRENKS